MADNIVGGLFGIDPTALQQQQQATMSRNAFNYANLNPAEQGQYGAYVAGGLVGQAGQSLLGIEDPQLQKARVAKQLASQFDITSSDGLKQYAQALAQNGIPELANMAAERAMQLESKGLDIQKTKADVALQERKVSQDEKLREELMKLGDNPTEEQYLKVFRQFGSPDQQAKAIEASIARKAKAAGGGEGGVGTPGPVGKSGAYRDITGRILGPTEMKTVRSEFETNQRLLNTLNNVKESDVKDAESFVDWTTKGESKALASKATLAAQSKIAASQLLEQINQLPPGSASDADMRAAMKSFPGYSNPEALAEWVNRTKERLQFHIGRSSEQFGFKPSVTASAPLDLSKKKETQAQPSKGKTRTLKSGVVVTEE